MFISFSFFSGEYFLTASVVHSSSGFQVSSSKYFFVQSLLVIRLRFTHQFESYVSRKVLKSSTFTHTLIISQY